MPVAYQIDTEQKLVSITATGTLTVAELLALFDQIRNDPRFTPACSLFSDYRGITPIDLTTEGIEKLAQHAIDLDPGSCRIILVDNTLNYGIGRMYQSYMDIYGKSPALVTSSLSAVREQLTRAGIKLDLARLLSRTETQPNTGDAKR